MDPFDSSADEAAVLSVLTGTPLVDAAARAGMSPARLAQAVALYHAAGRAALDVRRERSGWHQAFVEFADYAAAEQVFRAHLLPPLRSASIAGWWFVRKRPCWRVRVRFAEETGGAKEQLAEALGRAVDVGAVRRWCSPVYEPETVAFGGPDGMRIGHALFHADSVGVLGYLQHTADGAEGLLDAKATSFLVVTLFLRAAGLEWGEQGDVWGRVEAGRPLPGAVPADRVGGMASTLRRLLAIDARPALRDGPLAPLRTWVAGMEHGGRALADAAREGRLRLGLRGILARHTCSTGTAWTSAAGSRPSGPAPPGRRFWAADRPSCSRCVPPRGRTVRHRGGSALPASSRRAAVGPAPAYALLLVEGQERYVVQAWPAGAGEGGGGDLDDDELGDELDFGGEQVAGACVGGVLFESGGDVDVGCGPVAFGVPGEGAAAECLKGCDFHRVPEGGVGVVHGAAGADQACVAEAADEGGEVAGADVVVEAEPLQRAEEVLAVVEGQHELAACADLRGTHERFSLGVGCQR